MKTSIELKNLHCDACVKISSLKIGKIPGVTSVTLTRSGNEASGDVESEREISMGEIQAALADTGYEVVIK